MLPTRQRLAQAEENFAEHAVPPDQAALDKLLALVADEINLDDEDDPDLPVDEILARLLNLDQLEPWQASTHASTIEELIRCAPDFVTDDFPESELAGQTVAILTGRPWPPPGASVYRLED